MRKNIITTFMLFIGIIVYGQNIDDEIFKANEIVCKINTVFNYYYNFYNKKVALPIFWNLVYNVYKNKMEVVCCAYSENVYGSNDIRYIIYSGGIINNDMYQDWIKNIMSDDWRKKTLNIKDPSEILSKFKSIESILEEYNNIESNVVEDVIKELSEYKKDYNKYNNETYIYLLIKNKINFFKRNDVSEIKNGLLINYGTRKFIVIENIIDPIKLDNYKKYVKYFIIKDTKKLRQQIINGIIYIFIDESNITGVDEIYGNK